MDSAVSLPFSSSSAQHPHLARLLETAREVASRTSPTVGIVYPCDHLALEAAAEISRLGLCRVTLIGPRERIQSEAKSAGIDLASFVIEPTGDSPSEAAVRAVLLANEGLLTILMKGSLHTDVLMSAVVRRHVGLRGAGRVSHVFLFDVPGYPKLLAVADCVVNIAPDVEAKRDIVGNAVRLLHAIGVRRPKVALVAPVESVTQAIPSTLDAATLVQAARTGEWPGAIIEGPLGFDNALSAEAARIKNIDSRVAGDPDLVVVPGLDAGNLLYKCLTYMAGAQCAGLVLGARIPVVLTSRADPCSARIYSTALAVLASEGMPAS